MATVITVVVAFVLWTSKAPMLLLYTKIFSVHTWLRYWCYGTLGLSFVWLICAMSPTFISCPRSNTVTPQEMLQCVEATRLTGIISGVAALLTDLIIILLPLPAVAKLQLPAAKRWGLAFLFLSGVL